MRILNIYESFLARIDFLTDQQKAKNINWFRFPKNEKLLLALKNIFPHPFDLGL